jgi:hypothetical protein
MQKGKKHGRLCLYDKSTVVHHTLVVRGKLSITLAIRRRNLIKSMMKLYEKVKRIE